MDRLPAVRGRPLVTLADLDRMPAPLRAESVVFFAQIATGHIKIGVTTRIAQRIRSLHHLHAEPVVLLATMVGGHPSGAVHDGIPVHDRTPRLAMANIRLVRISGLTQPIRPGTGGSAARAGAGMVMTRRP